jgi:hypothetical protein
LIWSIAVLIASNGRIVFSAAAPLRARAENCNRHCFATALGMRAATARLQE